MNNHMQQYPARPFVSIEQLAEKIKQHMQGNEGYLGDDFFTHAAEAFFGTGLGDGYAIAIELMDWYGYDIDRDEMEELDCIQSIYDKMQIELTSQWVKENSVKSPCKLGEIVEFKHGRKMLKGQVIDIWANEGKLLIKVDDMDGRPIIQYEDALNPSA